MLGRRTRSNLSSPPFPPSSNRNRQLCRPEHRIHARFQSPWCALQDVLNILGRSAGFAFLFEITQVINKISYPIWHTCANHGLLGLGRIDINVFPRFAELVGQRFRYFRVTNRLRTSKYVFLTFMTVLGEGDSRNLGYVRFIDQRYPALADG